MNGTTHFGEYASPAPQPATTRPDRIIEIVASPTDDLRPGARFSPLEFFHSLREGHWPLHMVVTYGGRLYWVTGQNELIDEAGSKWMVYGWQLIRKDDGRRQ